MTSFGSHIKIIRKHEQHIKICNSGELVSELRDSYQFDEGVEADGTNEEGRFIYHGDPAQNPIIPADEKPSAITVNSLFFDAYTPPSGGSTCYHTVFEGSLIVAYLDGSSATLYSENFEYDWDDNDGGGVTVLKELGINIDMANVKSVRISGYWLECFFDYYLFDWKFSYVPAV